ncbi:MAG TPA: polyprenyl synthetase family protein [Candidatus Krumholzibacteria bacterium]|nr:polyprenyl synthetase family protein [Candidatus Krumholzibacteria bacterium]
MMQVLKKHDVLLDIVERCNAVVVERIKENTHSEASIALESFNNGGKRLRPILLVLAAKVPQAEALEPINDTLIRLAGAVELVHLATLFHDDVIDQVDTRRAKLSARLKYGNYASVLTGDFALAEALELVQRSGVASAMPEFIRTLRVLVRGESLETSHKHNYSLSEAQYYEIISEKSASLFALSCKAGALASSGEYADALGHFGWNLGMAFQMIDDLDDMLDSPQRSYDCDLRNGYLSLPMIRVLDALQDGHRERLISIIENADFTPATERYIVEMCMEYGAFTETHATIDRHLERSGETLARFSPSPARELLTGIVGELRAYAGEQTRNFTAFLRNSA